MKKPVKPTPLPMKPGMGTEMKPRPAGGMYKPVYGKPSAMPMDPQFGRNPKKDALARMRGNK